MPHLLEAARGQVVICRDSDELSREAATRFAAVAQDAASARGRFLVALSGGKTPVGMYRLLAGELRERVPWDRSYLFWSDERCVPPDDPESNYGLAQRELLAHVPVAAERVFRMKGELQPQHAAAEYELILREVFGLAQGDVPRFDLLLLGMGEEGHTASLFPGSEVLRETQRLVAAVYVTKVKMDRLTLTLPVINHSRTVIELVSGANKAAALAQVLEGQDQRLPAQMVRPVNGNLAWIVDRAAAAELRINAR